MIKATNENILKLKPGDFYISLESENNFCKWKIIKSYWNGQDFCVDVITHSKTESFDYIEYEIGQVSTGFILTKVNFNLLYNIYLEFSLKKRINKLLEI